MHIQAQQPEAAPHAHAHMCMYVCEHQYNIRIHARVMDAPQGAWNHLGQPHMHAVVLHKMARENTDTENIWEHAQTAKPQ